MNMQVTMGSGWERVGLAMARPAFHAVMLAIAAGCAGAGADEQGGVDALRGAACLPDESAPPLERASYGEWQMVALPNTFCGDGSQYKFFVNYSNASNNLMVMFESGGACWDYESCSGDGGVRGAANPNGIADDHMRSGGTLHPGVPAEFVHIQLNRYEQTNPLRDYNFVFLPYCTGDVHLGNRVATYTSEDGTESLEFHHAGFPNMMKILPWLAEAFTEVPKLFVTGCSAGGPPAVAHYGLIREALTGTQCGYVLADAGPLFSHDSFQGPLQDRIAESWGTTSALEVVADQVGAEAVAAVKDDVGLINLQVADRYPQDRFASTYFRMDFNYSLYSYERFYEPVPDDAEIQRMWWEDTQGLMDVFDSRENLAYFIPYGRKLICSHCASIVTYAGTEIEAQDIDLLDFINHVLDNGQPLESYLEDVRPTEQLSKVELSECR